ncbi:4-hydroxyphenylacetate 3-monooxygenase oxygenase component [Geodia barretti]|uniref:4-hydroxyphenylacetate 3-monooxygenase oxygenase component n=1 Tax=Geodia barretti TaxID=519541 RepID=A0AA35X4N4_GEOBA|nr:4-hydroxyphenylacetate 3-monooxygenase oxygenase component [Geodia barretti]
MPARTGANYLERLREAQPEIHMEGQRIKDATSHPTLANGARTLASLYDLQHHPEIGPDMTFKSSTSGDQVGLSFIIPKTHEDLDRRRIMMRHWARVSCGMMGRTPDFLNVAVMSMAAASEFCGQNRPEFKQNIENYFEYIRENDLTLTHTLVNLQRSRSPLTTALEDRTDVALAVVKETDAGIIVNGARVLATLGPLSDEIIVYPARTHRLPGDAGERYAFGFALPCNTPGMKFLCRESFDVGRSHFDHPLGSRFEEMDAVVFFNNVLVPWERVFLLGDVELANTWAEATNRNAHTGHQVVTKNVVKCEFMLGLANPDDPHPGVDSIAAAEVDAKVDQWGVMCPPYMPLLVARSLFIQMYPRMAEILHFLGSSSLMALPTEADLNGPLGEEIRQYLDTDTASAEDRVRLFRLAWDTCCSSFASRQVLYERYFGGDHIRNATVLYSMYDKGPASEWVQEFLEME